MTWIDFALLAIWIVFLSVGARVGSIWIAACLAGGFFGAFLSDYYALSLTEWIGLFPGSQAIAMTVLFLLGAAVFLIPGWFLSRMTSVLFLGILDSAAGLFAGALVGLIAVALTLLLIVPAAPRVEKSNAWKNSAVARPLHRAVEELFNAPKLRRGFFGKAIMKGASDRITPAAKRLADDLKKKAGDAADDLLP